MRAVEGGAEVDNKTGKFQVRCGSDVEDVVCRMGQKCFHNIHYLCHTTRGACIPADACPFQALVSNLYIASLTRAGECAGITGTYDVRVWFTYNNGHAIAEAERTAIPFRVHIPLADVAAGCQEIVCEEGIRLETKLCATNLKLEVVEAALEAEKRETVCQGWNTRLKVIVEKEFLVFEHGLQRLCVARCVRKFAPHPLEGSSGEVCQPFVNPTVCPKLCTQDEVQKADVCDVCPPLQEKPKEDASSSPGAALLPALQGSPNRDRDMPTSPGAIKGRLMDENGNGLFMARIIASDGKQQFRARTNYKGFFLLPLYPDTYELTAMKRGYIAQTLEITLGSGEIKELELTLAPDPLSKGFRLKL